MSFDLSSFSQNVLDWTEKHAGLGGWVGALGAVFAIFVTWGLARAEYLRMRRQEKVKNRAKLI
jgi:purine-cytosine permease-like protein